MATLTKLPIGLVTIIGSFLNASDIGALRLIDKETHDKISRSFHLLFKTVKVSLIRISIQELSNAARSSDIGKEIKYLIIGTETLEQYELAPTSCPDVLRTMLAAERRGSGLRTWLQNIIVQYLPNLQRITIEDRPEDPANEIYDPNIGSAELMRRTSIDLRWNGPYDWNHYVPYLSPQFFHVTARSLVYEAVFEMLRYLDTRGMVLDLQFIIRGLRCIGQDRSYIGKYFNFGHQDARKVLDSHLTHITFGEDGRRYSVAFFRGSFIGEIREYVLRRGISLTERSVDG